MSERDQMRFQGQQLEYVRTRVARGEYRVDPEQVAKAMLERVDARIAGYRAVSEGGRDPLLALTDLRAI